MIEANDCKRWIVAKETGRGGFKHWQIRLETSNKEFFFLSERTVPGTDGKLHKEKFKDGWVAKHIPQAHVEEAQDVWDYERKEGRFWTSDDTIEIRKVRFGNPNEIQREILRTLRTQSVREIDVWYDPTGNHGKSWLAVHLFERGQALVVPRSSCTAEKISAYICSAYSGEEYIIVDIPRSGKITDQLYESLEEIKDGLVFDHRYSGRCKNIRGVKLCVFTNTKLDEKKLSRDRWRLHGIKKNTNALKGAPPTPQRGPPLSG